MGGSSLKSSTTLDPFSFSYTQTFTPSRFRPLMPCFEGRTTGLDFLRHFPEKKGLKERNVEAGMQKPQGKHAFLPPFFPINVYQCLREPRRTDPHLTNCRTLRLNSSLGWPRPSMVVIRGKMKRLSIHPCYLSRPIFQLYLPPPIPLTLSLYSSSSV